MGEDAFVAPGEDDVPDGRAATEGPGGPAGLLGTMGGSQALRTFGTAAPSDSSWRRARSEETTLSPYPSKGGARVRADRAALTLLSTRWQDPDTNGQQAKLSR